MKDTKLKKLLILAFWMALWQIGSMMAKNPLFLPGPIDTIGALFRLLQDRGFYIDVVATMTRCISAMILALIFGFILALTAYRWRVVREILSLPVAFFKSVPVMAVAIYILMLTSAGSTPVLVCWIMCFPIVYTNLLTGLDSIDADLLEMSEMYGIRGMRRLRFVHIPSMFPFFKSAMSLIAGMSWKAIVTAEILSVPRFSLGYELMNSKYYLNTDMLFAYVLVIIVISVSFEKLIKMVLAKREPREYERSKVLKSAQIVSRETQDEGWHNDTDCRAKTEKDNIEVQPKAVSVTVRSISKAYGDKTVFKNLSLEIPTGKVTALMAPSGSGKTTLARIISGLENADAGEIKVNADKIAFLFQESRLLPWLNAYDNLAIVGTEASGEKGEQNKFDSKQKYNIDAVLKAVGLNDEKWKLPTQLSGGMNFRLALARAFIYDGDLIIADEPFQGLDQQTKSQVVEKLWKPGVEGKTVLLITHYRENAEELADQIIEL